MRGTRKEGVKRRKRKKSSRQKGRKRGENGMRMKETRVTWRLRDRPREDRKLKINPLPTGTG